MRKEEQLDVAHNHLSGAVPEAVCVLPRLNNLNVSNNYFTSEPPSCTRVVPLDGDRRNCLPNRPAQRPPQQCAAFYSLPPIDCVAFQCKPVALPDMGRSRVHCDKCTWSVIIVLRFLGFWILSHC
jgi:hypothetical protein